MRDKGDGLFLFVFENEVSMNEVLNGGPWFILRQPIIVKNGRETWIFEKRT